MVPIAIASDHAGFEAKGPVIQHLKDLGYEIEDFGPHSDERCDYPDFANKVCETLKKKTHRFGILICGSGQGMAMRANKYSFIRAALCWNTDIARLAREHNNANVLCVGSRVLELQILKNIASEFLKSEFSGGRHETRVAKISTPTH